MLFWFKVLDCKPLVLIFNVNLNFLLYLKLPILKLLICFLLLKISLLFIDEIRQDIEDAVSRLCPW